MLRRHLSISITITLLVLGGFSGRAAAQPQHAPANKTITAIRVNPTPPRIDGRLDDEIWQHAPAFAGFTQREPNEGAAVSESTTVQVVYDDEALYIGIMAYDREPEKIIARLTRRDERSNSDRVSVDLDPYHDHQTAYWFGINAAGTLDDGTLFNDTDDDKSWDGVWIARSAIHAQGWSAEYKIPYHVLRFSPKESYTWGINIIRDIGRKKEKALFVMVPRNEAGWVSRMGHLEGIKGIHPQTALELVPYVTTRSTFEPGTLTSPNTREFFTNGGGDLRYGLTSNMSLNMAINPDFGQVEADPAVLNLSTYETFFEERRPFFVEGSGTFRTPIQLFYSRRIGRRPEYFSIPSTATLLDQPEFTTIAAAAKLTGKTSRKTTFGLLNAVTAPEEATIQQTARQRYRIEPLTNHAVGRVQQDILGGNSNVGLLITALNRDGAPSAYTGGVDWNIRWRKNTYEFSGQVAGSRVEHLNVTRQSGYGTTIKLAKTSGWLIGRLLFEGFSPGFNPNDLGYLERANLLNPQGRIELQKTHPWGLFRQMKLELNGFAAWNYHHRWANHTERWVNIGKGVNIEGETELKNFWTIGGGGFRRFESFNDLESRGGPLVVTPTLTGFFSWLESDSRHAVNGEVWSEWGSHNKGSSWHEFGGRVSLRPVSNVEFSLHPRYTINRFNAQWVANVDDNNDGVEDHFVFGRLRSHTLDLTTRANVTFTRNLSLQLYLQPFVAVGKYKLIHELARPSSYEFIPYSGLSFNPDFNRRSLRSNLVMRWEYQPGSTLFLVWAQSRSAFSHEPTFRPLRSLGNAFSDDGPNSFMIKLSYWLNV